MVVGLSSAALQGAPVVTQDVDLWFKNPDDPRMRAALRRAGVTWLPPVGLNPPVLVGEGVDLFDIVTSMHGLEAFDEERKRAVSIPLGSFAVPVLPLDRIIASKRALGRPKDRLYLKVLEDTGRAVKRRASYGSPGGTSGKAPRAKRGAKRARRG